MSPWRIRCIHTVFPAQTQHLWALGHLLRIKMILENKNLAEKWCTTVIPASSPIATHVSMPFTALLINWGHILEGKFLPIHMFNGNTSQSSKRTNTHLSSGAVLPSWDAWKHKVLSNPNYPRLTPYPPALTSARVRFHHFTTASSSGGFYI